jgi:hypothetical protein
MLGIAKFLRKQKVQKNELKASGYLATIPKKRIMIKTLYTISIFSLSLFASAQKYTGNIFDKETQKPVSYVNVGVVDKNNGTVADYKGKYTITMKNESNTDSLRFSCVGYKPVILSIGDYKKLKSHDIHLHQDVKELRVVDILPKEYKEKTLGITTTMRNIAAGFNENKLGYELGVVMKARKTTILKAININFSHISYDSIFYRINIYEETDNGDYANMLSEPLYWSGGSDAQNNTVRIDIEHLNIISDNNMLVTLEHITDLGEGYLYFCATPLRRTVYRKTSQDKWETAAIGISISTEALIER